MRMPDDIRGIENEAAGSAPLPVADKTRQADLPFAAGCGKGKVLVVDDEPNAVRVLSAILAEEGYRVVGSSTVERAIQELGHEDVDTIITDLKMPERGGLELFEFVTERHPDIPVIFLTAFGTVDSAVTAMTQGAFHYFVKPPDYLKLKGVLARAVEQRWLKRELASLKRQLTEGNGGYRIIGSTEEISRVLETVAAVKDSASSVLIQGSTGTGKELVARALHTQSEARREKPFVAVNCAAIPKELMESELFGYEKGAFTGAVTRRTGRFEEAAGGIVFLDEVGELELSLQAKLLRVLQEREVERLGSNKRIKVDFRLVSSTNRDLRKEVQAGNFREDLFYRINVIEIRVPTLQERRDDIPLMVAEFTHEFCIREKKMVSVAPEVMRALQRYEWPGNVRQLRNVVERLVVLAKGDRITLRDLPDEFTACKRQRSAVSPMKTLRDLEAQAVRETLQVCTGNKSKAARVLGISRKAFYRRLRELGIG